MNTIFTLPNDNLTFTIEDATTPVSFDMAQEAAQLSMEVNESQDNIIFSIDGKDTPINLHLGERSETLTIELTEGGGGSGTRDYRELIHKPTLNGRIIVGDRDSEYYGIDTHEEINNMKVLEIWNSIIAGG